jgi:cell shape-determining protein MreD
MLGLPMLLLLLGVLLASQFPVPFSGDNLPLLPVFPMVFYWALFYPKALPLWAVAVFGLLHDLLYGLPLGVSLSQLMLLMLACVWLRKRVMLSHFTAAWMLFAPIMLGLFLLLAYWQFWVSGIAMQRFMDAYDLAFFLSWLSYPAFHLLLNLCYHRLHNE